MALKKCMGFKIGMTQVFNEKEKKVVPVTAVYVGSWKISQLKKSDTDGYSALQLEGRAPKRGVKFIREIRVATDQLLDGFTVGQELEIDNFGLEEGAKISVYGKSKGLGFQGVMRRHGYSGGPKSHGSRFHRKPGAVGHMRGLGEVIKGKALPGRTGSKSICMHGLTIVGFEKDQKTVFVSGSLPGKAGSLVVLQDASLR